MSHSILHHQTCSRIYGIPGPLNFYHIAREIALKWTDLYRHCASSPFSLSNPVVDESGFRALRERLSKELFDVFPRNKREKFGCILKTDIAAYYNSIYIPSISWAIEKESGKAFGIKCVTPFDTALGQLIQNSQNGRLTGIPTGPDSSFLIGEVILSGIDSIICREGLRSGLRYSDDYKFGFYSETEAERAIKLINGILNEFKLELNSSKTKILASDNEESSLGVLELAAMLMENTEHNQRAALEYYFEQAFDLAVQDPSQDPLRYAVMRLYPVKIARSSWPILMRSLCQCAVLDPGILGLVSNFIRLGESGEYPIDRDALLSALNSIISKYAPLGFDNEVAWALWVLMQFGLALDIDAAKKVVPMQNSIVSLLALDAQRMGCLDPTLDIGSWICDSEEDVILGRHWLLAYEGQQKGWLNSSRLEKHINDHPGFAFLKNEGVSFYFHENSD